MHYSILYYTFYLLILFFAKNTLLDIYVFTYINSVPNNNGHTHNTTHEVTMSKANKSTQATNNNNNNPTNNNPTNTQAATAENEVTTMSTELSTKNNITESAPVISATPSTEAHPQHPEGVATDWLVVYPNKQSITVHTPTACTADEVATMLAQVAIVVLPQPKATRATSGVGTGSRIPKGLEVRESSVAKPVAFIRGTLADVMAANPTFGTSELVSYYVTTYGIAYHTARTQVQVHKADALATLAKRVPVA